MKKSVFGKASVFALAMFVCSSTVVNAADAISAEENDAINKALNKQVDHVKAASAHTPLPSTGVHPIPALELSQFTPEERKTLEKNNVIISSLEKNGHKRIRARIKVDASAKIVWETVHEERKTDPDLAYSKILECNGHSSTLEQKFQLIPVVGTSVCVMKNVEIPGHRIDYWLTKSDRFKALEGSWIVTPLKEGGTILELSSYIDMGLPVPRAMLDSVAGKKLERRLQNIRTMAEKHPAGSVAKRPEAGS